MTKASSFTLKNTAGEDVTLPKKGIVVLFFYPKANTPGCTIESKKFSELYPQFIDAGSFVFGISPDPHDKVCKFAEKHDFVHTLLADEDHAVADKYGVWVEKQFMGKKYRGVERKTFLIKDGEIVQEFKHKPGKTEEEVLAAVNAL